MTRLRRSGYDVIVSLVVAVLVLASVGMGGLLVATGVRFAATGWFDPGVFTVTAVGLVLLVMPFFTLRHHVRWLRHRRSTR